MGRQLYIAHPLVKRRTYYRLPRILYDDNDYIQLHILKHINYCLVLN